MKTWPRRMILAAALALLAGCGGKLTEENLNKVKNGMTEREVKAILGAPSREEASSLLGLRGRAWIYQRGEQSATVVFVNDSVFRKEGKF